MNQKKKLLFIKDDMSKCTGGHRVGVLIMNGIAKLADKYQVEVMSLSNVSGKCHFPLEANITHTSLFNHNIRLRNSYFKAVRRLKSYIKQNNIDVIINIGVGLDPIIALAILFTKTKYIGWEHSRIYEDGRYKLFARGIAAKFADAIVCLTDQSIRDYSAKYKIKNKIIKIYNPIDQRLQQNTAVYDLQSKMIISVGRLSPEKGYDMLAQVADIVLHKYPDWKWHIYGDGEQKEALEQQIEGLGLRHQLILMGNCDNIYERYPQYAMCVLTSRTEGLPMVLLEAKSNMLPLVSFDCKTGPSEIITDGVDGFLVSQDDIETMAERICRLIEDPAMRKTFSEQSTKNIGEFEFDNIVSQWCTLIDGL